MSKKPTSLKWSPETSEREIIRAARKLTSLQAKRRRILKSLKINADDIKVAKRNLKAIAQQAVDVDPMMPPLRLFGEAQS